MPSNWWLEKHEDGPDAGHHLPTTRKKRETEKRHRFSRNQWVLLSIVAAGTALVVWLWIAIAHGLPTLDQLENPHPELATQLISADGERLDQYYIKNRTSVELRQVPRDVIAALIATEDRD